MFQTLRRLRTQTGYVSSVANGDDNGQPNGHALFEAANKMRGSLESAEYKHLVLGLIFLKYISDAFEQRRDALEAELSDAKSKEYIADTLARAEELDDRDAYAEKQVFWVPEQARWPAILASASSPDIAKRIDDALSAIEGENRELRRMLPRVYSRAPLSAELLGSLVETIAKIGFGKDPSEARDILGRTYEYFIKEFARAEGHRGGEYFTPAPVARLLVEMLEPYEGRIFDPACGSCGLFVQSAKFVEAHGGRPEKISVYGQERNQATWRIGRMNLAIHGLSGEVQYTEGGSLLDDAFPTAEGRLRDGQSAFQPEGVVDPRSPRRRTVGARRAARRQRQLCLDTALPAPSRAQRSRRLRDGQRFTHNDEWRRGQDPRELDQSRRRRLHRGAARTALLHDGHSGVPVVLRPRQVLAPASATVAKRHSSSTRARWAARSAAPR